MARTTTAATLSKSDPYLINRIVGFHEYGKALFYLDRLVRRCDRYELEAIEEIVKSEPEFAIYTVSAENNPNQRDANVDSSPDSKLTSPQNGRKRHGFKWITALARTELGAMYAAFSESPRPFSHFPTPGYDSQEFKFLLAESARVHYWSLNNDPQFMAITKRFQPTRMTLAYLRRLNVATAFAQATRQSATPVEARTATEMQRYAKQLDNNRLAIRMKIQLYLSQLASSTRNWSRNKNQLSLAELCNADACRQFSVEEGK